MARAVQWLAFSLIFIGTVCSAPSATSTTTAAPGESPLDLIYQAADDDMNSIGIDNSVETSTDTKTEAPQETTVPSTTVASTTTTEKTVPTTTMGTTTAAPESETSATTPAVRTKPTTRRFTTRYPVSNDDDGDGSDGTVVNIKRKPAAPKRKPLSEVIDEIIEKEIMKIFQGASQNHERIRNRNLRRLLHRFQVLAIRSDLSSEEFHKFMRLVSDYTPSRIPTFLFRKNERRQFQEANRIRWQHIREHMEEIGRLTKRENVIENFLAMVERDGALSRRFGTRPRPRNPLSIEEQLRSRPAFVNRFLAFMPLEEHPLLKQLLNGRMFPPERFPFQF